MKINEIRTGDMCFLSGKTKLATEIQKAQKDRGFKNYKLNHVGIFVWINNILCVAEEDFPAVFDINPVNIEYIQPGAEIYVGRVKGADLSEIAQSTLLFELLEEASSDKITNYAFLDILSFKANSLLWKWFGIDVWIGRKKNKHSRYTCSQITCLYMHRYFDILKGVDHLHVYPAQLADDESVELFKIDYFGVISRKVILNVSKNVRMTLDNSK